MQPTAWFFNRAKTIRRRLARTSRLVTDKYFFGQTRFSILSPESKSWQLTRGASDAAEYSNVLFSDQRMEPRCTIFCDIAAPLYQRMAERHNYRHFVLYSPSLPEKWRSRLEATAARYPVLQLVPTDTDKVMLADLVAPELERLELKNDALIFGFRIDDDDLVAIDFLDQVSPLVSGEHHGFAISLARGYAAIYEGDVYTEFRQFDQPMIAIGLGTVGRWHSNSSRLDLPKIVDHRRTHHRRTVLLDARRPTVLWTRHVAQDSAPKQVKEATDSQTARVLLQRELRRFKFVDDVTPILERFPTLQGRIDLT